MTRLNNYFFDLEIAISKILTRKRSVTLAYDILDTDKTRKNKIIALSETQRLMKVGEI